MSISADFEYDYLSEEILSKLEEEQHLSKNKPKVDDVYYYRVHYSDFLYSVIDGDLEQARQIIELNPSIYISSQNERVFREACYHGRFEVASWLLVIKPNIYISAYNEYAFRNACKNGHLKIAKWLLKIRPTINISAGNHDAFRSACKNGRLEVAMWLKSLYPNKYSVQIFDNKIFSYNVL